MSIGSELTAEQREALREIVTAWVSEGFTTPPYTDEQYDIFEWLGGIESHDYDTKRPTY